MRLSRRAAGVILVLSLFVVVILLVTNPFNWGVAKSARYSPRRFAKVERGMKVDEVVELLGPPLRIVNGIEPPLCPAPSTCRNFVFADDAKPWVLAHEKAWVIVDEHGRVVNAITYAEP